MRKTLALFCLSCGISVTAAWAAQAPVPAGSAPANLTKAADDQPDEPTSIDLIVHDRKGRTVTDLEPQDLAVTDDGAPVKISSLRLVNGAQGPTRMVALVFGQMDVISLKNARSVADKVLKMFPEGGFAFAVFGVDGRLRLFQPYTTERIAVSHAVDLATAPEATKRTIGSSAEEEDLLAATKAPPNSSTTIEASKEQSQAKMIYAALQQSQHLVQDQHTEANIAGLTAIAQAERQLPGRKAIVYFAQSAQTDVNTVDQMRTASKAANEAGASIFAVDMNALDPEASQAMVAASAMGGVAASNHFNPPTVAANASGPVSGFQSTMTPLQLKAMNDNIATIQADGMAGNKGPLGTLSAQTGGKCVGSQDNLKKPIQQLIADLTSYYEVSYAPRVEIYDGRFHPVSVKAQRAGLYIHARPGYLALPRGEESTTEPIDASLMNAMKSPAAPTDVDFRSAVLQFGKVEDGIAGELAVEVPVANIEVREDPNTDLFSLHVAVAARVEDKTGKMVQEFSEDIRRHGGLDSLDAAHAEFVSFERRVTLLPGDYVLKTVVVDSDSGKVGAKVQPFHVDPAPDHPSLSDIVLVRQTGDSGAPALSSGKVVPNLTGNIPANAKDISLFFMVQPEQKPAEPPQVAVSISKDGKQLGEWPLHVANERQKTLIPYLSSLNTAKLPSGSYEVTVSLKQGEETAERHLTFIKEGGSAPASAEPTETAANPVTEPPGPVLEEASAPLLESSSKAAVAPSPQQTDALIETARKRALGYSAKLPNFMCVEIIDRSVDRSGKNHWTHQDNIAELLRYRDNAESRVVLEVNGRRSSVEPSEMKGAQSNGEFGGLLKAIFEPSAAAKFKWDAEKQLSTGTVQVLSYQVAQKNSALGLTDSTNWTLNVAFHGVLYIEPDTGAVRYATVEASDLPAKFGIHASSIQVVYDYIAINNHDYLLPVRGTVGLREGKHQAVLNTLQFREYKRFASQSRILPVADTASAK